MSAYLKKSGHACDVVIEYAEKDWLRAVKAFKPDLIAFSVLSGSYQWALQKASFLRTELGKPIIFGGVHVFLNPLKTIEQPAIDIICTGEGEVPLLELCQSMDGGKIDTSIKGLWFKDEAGQVIKNPPSRLIDDLDSIPLADRSIYYKYPEIRKREMLPMLGSRGCPYACTYCFIPSAKEIFEGQGKFIRERGVESVVAEVEACIHETPHKQLVHFVEDHFGNNRQKSLAILQRISRLKGRKLRWGGAIRVERFIKESYVEALSKTNHALLGIAVECGDEDYRRDVLQRPVTNAQIIEAAALAKKYGIRFTTLNMLGLPGETFEQALMTLDLNIKLKPVYASCYVYQPYPGTKLQQYSVEHKIMDESIVDQIGLSFYDRYWKNNAELNRIINLQRVFGVVVHIPILKKPFVYLARNNFRVAVDLIFGIYYLWYLLFFYRLTPAQVWNLIHTWIRSQWIRQGSNPAHESIKQGEGQLYPNISE